MEDFIAKTEHLLSLERKVEVEQCEELLSTQDSKRLEAKGLCITKLSVSHQRIGLYGRSVVTFTRGNKKGSTKDLPSSHFTTGDIVGVFAHNRPLKDDRSGHNVSGIVCHISQHSVNVAIDDLKDVNLSVYDSSLKLIKLTNDVTYRRLSDCLRSLKDATGLPRKLFGEETLLPADITVKSKDFQGASACTSTQFFNTHLDQYQRDAVLFALSRQDVAIIHGPPGTGKTTTLIEVILQHVAVGCKVLACAPSNIAVDNIVERLHQQKVKIVRLGHPARVVPWVHKSSLDAILSNSDSGAIVRDVRSEINQILTKVKETSSGANRAHLWKELKYLKKELHSREEKAIKDILTSADVVLSTNVGASLDGPIRYLPKGHFSLVVIDECAQALEVSCWIPLLLASKCVLAGDHQQLPPTIISNQAAKEGLNVSIMERLDKVYGDEITYMLQVQYRMNSVIMKSPSEYFYDSKLIAAEAVSCHLLSDLPNSIETSITSAPLLFIDTNGCELYELKTEENESKGNEGEADLVLHYVKCLVEANIEPSDIAVIAPYNLQVQLIRQRLQKVFDNVEVKTVDGFQGREKETVIISLTRSNLKGEVGFLSEQRRSNVAVTRARRHLAIIGDSSTVSHEPFLNQLLDHISSAGEVQSAFDYIHDTEFQHQVIYKQAKPLSIHKQSNSSKSPVQCKTTLSALSKVKITPEHTVESVEVMEDDNLVQLKNVFSEELLIFVADKDKIKVNYPSSLSSLERKALHETAEEMNLEHVSHGNGPNRYICISKPLRNTSLPYEEVNQKDIITSSSITEKNTFCLLDDQSTGVNSVRSVTKHSSSKKKKSKPMHESKIKGKEDNDDDLLDLYVQSNNTCGYSGCKKNIKLFGQTCKFCCKLFCLSHHQAELHGCGEEAKIAARKETLQQASRCNYSKRSSLQKRLENNIKDLKSKRQSKK